MDENNIRIELYKWYEKHKRNLPWRETTNPYYIWLSEIILQQTRVAQALPYYVRFVEAFPKIEDLARASELEVLKLWQGLGYYSRARNLHATAKTIVKEHNAIFPSNYNSIRSLKGVGDYTAAAIASFAFKLPYAAIDGNVLRVLSRLYAIDEPIDSTVGKKLFRDLGDSLLDAKHADLHNQAIMEFGALQCVPKSPNCPNCPLRLYCRAASLSKVELLPLKKKKAKPKLRYFNYLLMETDKGLCLGRRNLNDIWKGLYQFPLIETKEALADADFLEHLHTYAKDEKLVITKISDWEKQVLSHQHIHYRYVYLSYNETLANSLGCSLVCKEELIKFAVPKPVEKKLHALLGKSLAK